MAIKPTFKKRYTSQELRAWLYSKAKTPSGLRRRIVSDTDRNQNIPMIGKLYFYWYDPKYKDTLPIYDRFPLVFPIEPYSNGFLGLNLHYLDINEREALLNKLLEFADNKNILPSTRLKLSYALLSSTKRLASLSRPCIKRYLFGHVRSKYIEVTADEWDKAIQLAVEFFVTRK